MLTRGIERIQHGRYWHDRRHYDEKQTWLLSSSSSSSRATNRKLNRPSNRVRKFVVALNITHVDTSMRADGESSAARFENGCRGGKGGGSLRRKYLRKRTNFRIVCWLDQWSLLRLVHTIKRSQKTKESQKEKEYNAFVTTRVTIFYLQNGGRRLSIGISLLTVDIHGYCMSYGLFLSYRSSSLFSLRPVQLSLASLSLLHVFVISF